jgi:hypothetical protein
VVVEVVFMTVVVGEVEVTLTRDLLHEKGGKMAVAVMGRQKNAASAMVSLGILPRSADLRRRLVRPTWPGGGIILDAGGARGVV